jgi:hypothetical protein
MIKKKVRDFGTPDSRKDRQRNIDTIMKNDSPVRAAGRMVHPAGTPLQLENVMPTTDANGVLLDAFDKLDF